MTDTEKNKLQNEIKFLNEEIKKMITQRESANNEHTRAVDKLQKLMKEKKQSKTFGDKVELIKKIKELEKDLENSYKTIDVIVSSSKFSNLNKYGFDKNGIHKDTGNRYDANGFNIDGFNKDTGNRYDRNGFDRSGLNKDTNYKFDPNDFNRDGIHNETKNEYDPNGFNRDGIHKDTGTFFNKENVINKNLLKNLYWLKNKDEFLKLYNEIIKKGEFTGTANKKVISSKIF